MEVIEFTCAYVDTLQDFRTPSVDFGSYDGLKKVKISEVSCSGWSHYRIYIAILVGLII